ncbi:hypothetical protein NPIL_427435 [Nephila pilipes]|uniref:Uncharacterized protein n=1 Tax=Nephila pilipes TaxID=299642 RepID=A0A8X6PNM8_NEPPI|nr:hypothetical protein NPIL_427435 [Nephila pilipes]
MHSVTEFGKHARKRPVPYRRPSPSTPSSTSSWSYRSSPPLSRSSSPVHALSPVSRGSSRSRSQSWSPVIRQKYEVPLNTAIR